ncbi:MAG TPA: type II toxin-antitoxin system VapC family toxin [Tepidisphaeraceae bacterium]|jgi:hypothetical protein|nr:type II toxin-antitoxin system VapC family toxin [Tepidisphaeraceae bacterium]
MIVLDTNVLSTMMQGVHEPAVKAWLDAQPISSLWTTAISVFEVRYGLALLPAGEKQRGLQEAFEQAVHQDLAARVLAFDTAAAIETAVIAAKLRSIGRPIDVRDAMIVGTVAAHQGTLATRNIKHFADTGIPLINPWQLGPPGPP